MCHCEWITSAYAPGWGRAKARPQSARNPKKEKGMFDLILLLFSVASWIFVVYVVVVILSAIYDTFFKEPLQKMNDKYFNDKR